MRRLEIAREDHNALERAVGAAFRILGFRYERKGGSAPGPDGILYARLGRQKKDFADYKLVYDAKQTDQPSVPADKIDPSNLERFRIDWNADFGFFAAYAYSAETDCDGAINRKMVPEYRDRLALIKIDHLRRLVLLHYSHGVTLSELRSLFEKSCTVMEVGDWIEALGEKLQTQQVPLKVLLEGLEREKSDRKAIPNIIAVRAKHAELEVFEPERLVARLKAIESIIGTRWIEIEDSGEVLLHQTASEILIELNRNIGEFSDYMSDEAGEMD